MSATRLRLSDFILQPEDSFFLDDLAVAKSSGRTGLHIHDFYEFFVVLSGEFIEYTPFGKTMVSKRQAHILGPEDEHNLCAADRFERSRLRNIAVRREVFEDALRGSGLDGGRLHRYFELDRDSFQAFRNKTDLAYRLDPSSASRAFLMRTILDDILISALVQYNNDRDIPGWLKSVYHAMENEENFILGLPRMIELSGKSQEHLTRSFGRYYGMTPSEYVNLLRLQAVAWRLQNSTDKVIDIVYHYGFNNISYFNRLFRERYHQTPLEYRQRKMF